MRGRGEVKPHLEVPGVDVQVLVGGAGHQGELVRDHLHLVQLQAQDVREPGPESGKARRKLRCQISSGQICSGQVQAPNNLIRT